MDRTDYLSELSKCVKCGSCKAYCPTYDEGLTETAGARGRLTLLRGLLTGQLSSSPLLKDRIFSCILCGACETLCAPHVDITAAICQGRRLLGSQDRRVRCLRLLTRFFLRRPAMSFKIARSLQQVGITPWKSLDLLSALYRWALAEEGLSPGCSSGVSFQVALSHSPLRDDRQVYKPERKIGRIALFTGCSTNFLFPRLGKSLINVLVHLGYEVVLPKGEVCCGAPFRSLGFEEDAAALARKNVEIFGKLNAEAILSLCPTCVLSMKTHYPKLLGKGLENVMDAPSFLLDRLGSRQLFPLSDIRTATYHDPCHLNYSLGVRKEPRELIRRTGVELREAEDDGCCGFGGLFSLHHRDLSKALLSRRVAAYTKTGADVIVTSCAGCMLQLSAGIKSRPVSHLIELVEKAVCGPG